jgi:hypothetical protein
MPLRDLASRNLTREQPIIASRAPRKGKRSSRRKSRRSYRK